MTFHPIFPVNGKWHVEIKMPDGSSKIIPFDSYSAAFDFYRQPEKIKA